MGDRLLGFTEYELIVMGCLTPGPLTGEQLKGMVSMSDARLARALKRLAAHEWVVRLPSGRWALIHR